MRSLRRNIEKNRKKQEKLNKKISRAVFTFGIGAAMSFMMNGSAFADVSFPQATQLDNNVTTQRNGDTFQIQHGSGQVFNNNWNSFDVPTAKTVDFNFSQNGQVSINRVVGNQASQILGRITESGAGGKVFLLNPHGVMFGKDSSVNLGSFTVSTANLINADLEKGIYKFEQGSIPASIINNGTIKVSDEGFVALMAPVVKNAGTIEAKQGTIGLVSGNKYTLTTGSGQDVSIKIDEALSKNLVDSNEISLISNTGTVKTDGGSVIISTKAMNDVIQNAVNNTGLISANSVTESNGQIVLGNVDIDTNKSVWNNGTIEAKGGNVDINGGSLVNNATIDVSSTKGGNIKINATSMTLDGKILAKGSTSDGGNISIHTAGSFTGVSDSVIDASGKKGGLIHQTAGGQILTSGKYLATGTDEKGGKIQISANALKLLSADIDASGSSGGEILLGGEYRGANTGVLLNSNFYLLSEGSKVKANATSATGDGGTIINWSDGNAYIFGDLSATPGELAQHGGWIEISAKEGLSFLGDAKTSKGSVIGNLTFDPKNITIGSVDSSSVTYNAAISSGFGVSPVTLANNDYFGSSVAMLDGKLAVGALGDNSYAGAVYLFTYAPGSNYTGLALNQKVDSSFTGLSLTGGDRFGGSVAMMDGKLAVGAHTDTSSAGAVYLFTYTPGSNYTGLALSSPTGITGGKITNGSLGLTLSANNKFGSSVAMIDGKLAVGAIGTGGKGAVYLFTFGKNQTDFAGLALSSPAGITGGKLTTGFTDPNTNVLSLAMGDNFGASVAMIDGKLAVGAFGDSTCKGAVYLFTFGKNQTDYAGLALSSPAGITGGKLATGSLGLTLLNSTYFGGSVAMIDGKLAVGAEGDSGFKGAVYLFNFGKNQTDFAGLALSNAAGLTGGKINTAFSNLSLAASDSFGYSVAMIDGKLAVGAPGYNSYTGAVHLFNFTAGQTDYNGLAYNGKIYSGSTGVQLDANDQFGSSLAMIDGKIAVGAIHDDTGASDAGAVYLFGYTPGTDYTNLTLNEKITSGTFGMPALSANSYFGTGLAMIDGKLAVGAVNRNAVYLFTFDSGTAYNSLALSKTLNSGSVAGFTLTGAEQFGQSVAMIDGKLAVGAARYDTNAGEVFLFSYTAADFSDIAYSKTIRSNTYGMPTLSNQNYFGTGLAMIDGKLAVGAFQDFSGATRTGTAYLFTFSGSDYTGLALSKTLDSGSVAGFTLPAFAQFGYSLAMTDGNLAVGAFGEDSSRGAVYLFTFDSGTPYTGLALNKTIRSNTFGMPVLDVSDQFGNSVAMINGKLAVGANRDDTAANDAGAVYLFTLPISDRSEYDTYADNSSSDMYISASRLATLLAGNHITLSANNDITLNSDLLVNNTSGNGSNLTLKAGRSILLNANITTDNGNLTLTANDTTANGVVNAQRDAGNSVITMAGGTSINTGTGTASISLLNGAGKTNLTSGDITLRGITSNALTVLNQGPTAGSDIVLSGNITTTGNLTLSSTGEINGSGIIDINGSTSLTAGTTSDITLNTAGNDFTGAVSVVSGRDVTLNDTNAIGLGASNISRNLIITANGAVTDSGAIAVTGTTTLTAGSGNNITLDNLNNFTGAVSVVSGNNVTFNDTNSIDLGASNISGNLNITTAGTITDSGAIAVTGTTTLTAGSGNNITLNNLNNFTGAVSVVSGNNVTLNDTNAIGLGLINTNGNLIVNAGGRIDNSNVMTISGTTTLTGTGIGLDTGSTYGGDVSLNSTGSNNVSIFALGNLSMGNSSVGGNLILTSLGTITQTGFLIVPDTLYTNSGATNNTTLSNASNDFGTVRVNAGNNVSINDLNGVNIGLALVSGDFTLTANGAVTDSGNISVTGLANITSTGNTVTLGDTTTFNAGSLNLQGTTVSVTEGSSSELADVDATNFNLTSNGAITQTGALAVTGTTAFSAAGYDITLNNVSNNFGGAVGIVGNTINLIDSNAMTLGAISSNSSINIATLTGDLTISDDISTTNGSGQVIILNAGKNATAGTSTGGNIIISGSPTITTGDGGMAMLYTGSVSGSTGLTTLIGSGSGRFLYNSDEAEMNYNRPEIAGKNAIYREQPIITVTANNDSKTYDGLAYSGGNGVGYSGLVNGDTSAIFGGILSYGGTSQGAINANTYTITPSGLSNELGYALSYSNGALTVDKKALNVRVDASKTYGETSLSSPVTSYTGFENDENSTSAGITGSAGLASVDNDGLLASANAGGTYHITSTAGTLAANNYSFTPASTGLLTVNKKALTVIADDASKTYGDLFDTGTLTAHYTGFVAANGDDASNSLTGAASLSIASNAQNVSAGADTYAITPTLGTLASNNYSFGTFTPGTFTVNKRNITVTGNNASKTYGDANPSLSSSVTLGNLVNSDTLTGIGVLTNTAATALSGAGTYNIIPSGILANYNPTYANGTLTVNKKALTVIADDASKTYGDLFNLNNLTAQFTGFVNGDDAADIDSGSAGFAIASNAQNASVGAGTYNITPDVGTLTDNNYSFGTFNNGTFTVNKRNITVTGNNASKTYGDVNPSLSSSVTLGNLVNSDTLSGIGVTQATDAGQYSPVSGSYYVRPSGILTNYNPTYADGILTINKKALTVIADDAGKTYGDLFDVNNLTAHYTGFVAANGDNASNSLTGAASLTIASNAQNADIGYSASGYAITPTLGTLTSNNYSFGTFTPGTFTVNKKALSIEADDFTRKTNEANPAFTAVFTGLVNSDTEANIGTLDLATTADTISPAGSYAITPSILAHGTKYDNYNISLVNGSLTVERAANFTPANDNIGNTLVDKAPDIATEDNVNSIITAITNSITDTSPNTFNVTTPSIDSPTTYSDVVSYNENTGNNVSSDNNSSSNIGGSNTSTADSSSSNAQPENGSSNDTNVKVALTDNTSSNTTNVSSQQENPQETLDTVSDNLNMLASVHEQNLFEVISGRSLFDFITDLIRK